jgi:hypothetical protein
VPPQSPGHPFVIDVSKGRISRQVRVDMRTVEQMQYGSVDAIIARELRTAMQTVARLMPTPKKD